MAFTENFRQIEFNPDKEISEIFRATQGDTKSQGFNIIVFLGGEKKVITTETMSFFAQKPDGTRVTDVAVKDGDGFKIELKNQVFAVPGVVVCTLVLRGANGEKLAGRQFKIIVAGSMEDGAIISEDEREILDRAFDLATDIIPRFEALDIEAIEHEMENLTVLTPEVERAIAEADTATGNANLKITEMDTLKTDLNQAETSRVQAENDRTTAETARAGFYDTYNQELQELAEIKADKDYTDEQLALKADLSEIEVARGTKPTLGARLDGTDAQLAEIENNVTDHEDRIVDIETIMKSVKIDSWKDVQKIVRAGIADKVFDIGDSFAVKYDGVDHTWDVIGINHDIPADSNYTNSLTIQSRDCLMNCAFDTPEPTNPDADIKTKGNNNYKTSNIRQWLNSSDAQFNFVKQHEFDEVLATEPYTGAGFLHNLDPELREVIGPVKKQVAKNTVTDGGGQDTFEDTVFLLSQVEVYGGVEGDSTGEKPYEYYSVLAPSATLAALSGRIKYLSGAARFWWLRSPSVRFSGVSRGVSTTGNVGAGGARNPYGLAPACTIY